jgi:hypothetical protein
MTLKCPACSVTFSPTLRMVPLGTNKEGNDVYLYFQNCPKCNELLIAVKKMKLFAPMPSFNDTEGLIFLKE